MIPLTMASWLCMTTAIYFEARDQSIDGQLGVSNVIISRVHDPRYPDNICDVTQDGPKTCNRNTREDFQFSFYCDGKSEEMTDDTARMKAMSIGLLAILGVLPDNTNGATHYHADYVTPSWSHDLQFNVKIDDHLFYTEH